MVAIAIESPAIVVSKLAREAMEECNYDRIQAIALFKRWLVDDPELRAQLAESFEDDGIAAAIRGVDSTTRQQLDRAALRSAPDHASQRARPTSIGLRALPNPDQRAERLAAIQDDQEADPDFHKWPMPGGGLLYDATPADVLLAARSYGQTEATMRINRRFFELIYEAMQGGSCVGKVLPQSALKRLRRRAKEEEAGR
jgi:hypothetical protein